MSGYKDQTILETIREINKSYFLPSIQRKFVWDIEQIEKLFDSIMRDYPIGTFLFWEVEKGDDPSHIDDYTFYKFIEDYNEKDGDEFLQDKLNKPSCLPKIVAVLDGQQRLSSLFCALRGSYATKVSKKISSYDQYPKKELYFDLHYKPSDDNSCKYKFSFLLSSQAQNNFDGGYWLKVKDVLSWTESKDNELNVWEKAKKVSQNVKAKYDDVSDEDADKIIIAIVRLWKKLVCEDLITYFKIDRSELDDILEIFVRVNSAGTSLSLSDLVFSTIVASWEDGREKIENLISLLNEKGDHFKFDKDFVINLCLSLMDLPQKFAVRTFTQENVNRVKVSWERIVIAISETVDLLVEFGFNADNLTADYIIIPVAYYLYKSGKKVKNLSAHEKEDIRKFLIYGMLKKIFSAGVDGVLTSLLNALRIKQEESDEFILKRSDSFDFEALRKLKFQDRKLDIDAADLESILDLKKGPLTFMVLSLLYPHIKFNEIKWHQDHIHPKALFDKKKLSKYLKAAGEEVTDIKLAEWKTLSDTVINLQLLTGNKNQEKGKTPLSEWIRSNYDKEEDIERYAKENYIDKSIGFEQFKFELFYKARRELLKTKLAEILDIDITEVEGEEVDEVAIEAIEITIADAVHKVLSQHPEGLSVQEIYDQIIEQNLYEFGAKKPKAVVNTTIQRWCIGSKQSREGSAKLFKVIQEIDGEIYYGNIIREDLVD